MATIVTQPGIYPNMGEDEYRADPCETPSLNASTAKVLLAQSPLHAKARNVRLGGVQSSSSEAQNVGSVIHSIVLGTGKKFVASPFDDYKTKAAREWRDSQAALGMIPMKPDQIEKAKKSAEALMAKIPAEYAEKFAAALPEVSGFYKEGGTWCRVRFDKIHLGEDRITIFDVKKVDEMNLSRFERYSVMDYGYDIQRAMYVRAAEAIFPEFMGRVDFVFLLIEDSEPFDLVPFVMDGEWQAIGVSRYHRALGIWRQCLASGEWPGVSSGRVYRSSPPEFILKQEIAA